MNKSQVKWILAACLVTTVLCIIGLLVAYFLTRPKHFAYNGRECVPGDVYVSLSSCQQREASYVVPRHFSNNGGGCVRDNPGTFTSEAFCQLLDSGPYSHNGTACVPDSVGLYTTSQACEIDNPKRYKCTGTSCTEDVNGPQRNHASCITVCSGNYERKYDGAMFVRVLDQQVTEVFWSEEGYGEMADMLFENAGASGSISFRVRLEDGSTFSGHLSFTEMEVEYDAGYTYSSLSDGNSGGMEIGGVGDHRMTLAFNSYEPTVFLPSRLSLTRFNGNIGLLALQGDVKEFVSWAARTFQRNVVESDVSTNSKVFTLVANMTAFSTGVVSTGSWGDPLSTMPLDTCTIETMTLAPEIFELTGNFQPKEDINDPGEWYNCDIFPGVVPEFRDYIFSHLGDTGELRVRSEMFNISVPFTETNVAGNSYRFTRPNNGLSLYPHDERSPFVTSFTYSPLYVSPLIDETKLVIDKIGLTSESLTMHAYNEIFRNFVCGVARFVGSGVAVIEYTYRSVRRVAKGVIDNASVTTGINSLAVGVEQATEATTFELLVHSVRKDI